MRGQWVSSPRPWGSEIDVAIRNEFLADKYHTAVCTVSLHLSVLNAACALAET